MTLLDEGTERGTYVLGDAEEPPNDQFCDAHRTTPRHVDSAISVIYELGVTVGQADATTGPCAGERIFGPEGSVTRGQMAAFITSALGHTNARPAGLTAQNTSDGVVVSVRDSEHAPVVNLPIDAFYYSTDDVSRAFNVDDECTRRVLPVEAGTFSTCEIGPDDPVTQTDGNAVLSPIPAGDIGEDGVTVVVWTGRDEETYEDGITLFYKLTITEDEAELPPPGSASVTSDREEETNHARYGSRVTFTIQLQGEADSGEMVDVPREKGEDGEISYTLVLATYRNPADLVATGNGITAEDLADSGNDATLWRRTTEEVVIARDGTTTFSVTASDPDTMAASADTSYAKWTLESGRGDPAPDPATGIVVFSDGAGTATNVEITTPEFVLASGDTRRAASNTVTVTVTDQYGNPVRGARVTLTSDQMEDSEVPERARSTARSGQVRITYRYTGDAGVEMLRASLEDGYRAARDLNDDGDTLDDGEGEIGTEGFAAISEPCHTEDVCGDTDVFWAVIWESDLDTYGETSDGDFAILNADLDDNEIVADSDTGTAENEVAPVVVYYDSTDYFDVDAGDDSGPVSMAAFEEALEAALEAYEEAAEAAEMDANISAPDRPTIAWTSYESDDDADIARFSLVDTITS